MNDRHLFRIFRLSRLGAAISIIAFLTSASAAQRNSDAGYQSYLAHIAAASSALRLNETGDAKRWLRAAPAAHRNWEWRMLTAMTEESDAVFGGFDGSVVALAISPDGRLMLTATSEKTVKLSGERVNHVIRDEKLSPQSVVFSPDGTRFAVAYSRHKIRIFDTKSGLELRTFQGAGKGITAVAFSPDGKSLASCSWNVSQARGVWGIVEIWNSETGADEANFEYGIKPLSDIEYSPDGKFLAVGSWEVQDTVAVWRVGNWTASFVLESEKNDDYKAVQSISFSPDGKLLAAGGKDSAVRIWEVESRKRLHTFSGHTKDVNGVAFSRDGKSLYSVSTDQTLRIWNAADGTERSVLHGHDKRANAVAVSSDDSVFTGASDSSVRKWLSRPRRPSILRVVDTAYGLAFSPDSKTAVTAGWGGKIRVWDHVTGAAIADWDAHGQSANSVAFSPDGKRLASIGNDGRIKLWDSESRREIRTFGDEVRGGQLTTIAFCGPNRLISATTDSATIFDVATGAASKILNAKTTVVACSPDGSVVATGGSEGAITVWNAITGAEIRKSAAHKSRVMSVAFSADGRRIVSAAGRSAVVLDTRTLAVVLTLDGHDDGIFGVSISPDGTRIVTSSADQTVKFWDSATGANVLTLTFDAPVYGAYFDRSGRELWTLPMDKTVRVFNAR